MCSSYKTRWGQQLLLSPFCRFYEECSDLRRVVRQLSYYQDEYNIGGNGAEMSLVLFPDAVRHLLRISRILRQPRGNAILIGLAGNQQTPGNTTGKPPQGERDSRTRDSRIPSFFPMYIASCAMWHALTYVRNNG